jgi:hypothetical protein
MAASRARVEGRAASAARMAAKIVRCAAPPQLDLYARTSFYERLAT